MKNAKQLDAKDAEKWLAHTIKHTEDHIQAYVPDILGSPKHTSRLLYMRGMHQFQICDVLCHCAPIIVIDRKYRDERVGLPWPVAQWRPRFEDGLRHCATTWPQGRFRTSLHDSPRRYSIGGGDHVTMIGVCVCIYIYIYIIACTRRA